MIAKNVDFYREQFQKAANATFLISIGHWIAASFSLKTQYMPWRYYDSYKRSWSCALFCKLSFTCHVFDVSSMIGEWATNLYKPALSNAGATKDFGKAKARLSTMQITNGHTQDGENSEHYLWGLYSNFWRLPTMQCLPWLTKRISKCIWNRFRSLRNKFHSK